MRKSLQEEKEYHKRYYLNNKEKITKQHKEYKKNNKDYYKNYYKNKKEYLLKQHKTYRENHKGYMQKYEEENKEELKKYRKEYIKKYPEKSREKRRKRRARKNNIIETFSDKEWLQVLKNTFGVCPRCNKYVGIHKLTLDHKHPISMAKQGQIYTIDDVQPLCNICNSKKHNKIETIND